MFEELLKLYKTKVDEIEKQKTEAQAMIMLVSAIEKLSGEIDSRQTDIELLGRLIDQVDRLSKDVADLKSQLRARQSRISPAPEPSSNDGKALDNHAHSLIDIMAERPGRYTTSELVDMLGLNKTTVISVMKRALEVDPKHIRMSQGKRRKLYLAYVPEEETRVSETESGESESDRIKLELMAMT